MHHRPRGGGRRRRQGGGRHSVQGTDDGISRRAGLSQAAGGPARGVQGVRTQWLAINRHLSRQFRAQSHLGSKLAHQAGQTRARGIPAFASAIFVMQHLHELAGVRAACRSWTGCRCSSAHACSIFAVQSQFDQTCRYKPSTPQLSRLLKLAFDDIEEAASRQTAFSLLKVRRPAIPS